jgi:hypothetical protein
MSPGYRSIVGLAIAGVVLLVATSPFAALTGSAIYAPPATGTFAYNAFVPASTPGAAYLDPVFGRTVRRLTTDHTHDDLYARNMWWNADGSRFLHRATDGTPWPDYWDVIDVATGTVTHRGLPNGGAISAADGGFDPVDPNALYYYAVDGIHKITLNANGGWSDALYFAPPAGATLRPLGGTLNWLDASGRYMVVRYGAEPSVYLYDRTNLAAGPYANPIDATNYIDPGSYIGVSPDGQFLVGYQSAPLPLGVNGSGQGVSWKLNHAGRSVAAVPNVFWSLCGDHGSFVSASDGHNYMVVHDCYSQAGLWRVDITNNAAGLTEAQQQALPNNRLLLAFATWNDFGHISTMATGDWAFTATVDGTDTFNSGSTDSNGNITPWHAYRQEIIAINVVSGEVQRLAHHRSRSVYSDYYSAPRLSTSWTGNIVGFASNFNQPGSGSPVVDIYAIPFTTSATPVTLSSVNPSSITAGSASFVLSATGSNFASTSTVQWNGADRMTTFVSSTQLRASIPASDVSTAGTAQVTVATPGATTSNAIPFAINQTYTLAVVKTGTGAGTVTSTPAGIWCGTSCSASFASGNSVVLTAAPEAGTSFSGWTGCDAAVTNQCTVVLTAGRTVTATFAAATDTIPPSVVITAPTAGDTVSGTIPVSATASDNIAVVGIQFKLDGTNLGAEVTTAPYSASWDSTTASNGRHTVTAVARDGAGNVATSASISIMVQNRKKKN